MISGENYRTLWDFLPGRHSAHVALTVLFCETLRVFFFFVVWKSIYDPGQTQERDGTEGLSFYLPRNEKKMRTEGLFFYHSSLLSCLDQMLEVTEMIQHLVSSSKSVRIIIPRGARCIGHVKIMWYAVCSLVLLSHFAGEARPRLYMDEPKRSTPVRRRLSLTQAVMVKLIPISLVLTLGM